MGTVADACGQDYASLEDGAVAALERAAAELVTWVELIRDPHAPWSFRWAPDSTRSANVAATHYILGAAERCGVLDRVLSAEQKYKGAEWIHSLEEGEDVFNDPALLESKPSAWDDSQEAWPPDGAHREAINQYARGCLRYYEDDRTDPLGGPPPPAWPQKGDAHVLEWIKGVEPNWSWIGRIIRRLFLWTHEGAIPPALLHECMRYAYSRQGLDTGFWGGGIQPTFKFLICVLDPVELPVPRARRVVDSVLRVMDEPTYDNNLFPCEEFDGFYDIALAWTTAPAYREEEIRKLAAHRIIHILQSRGQAGGGISSYPDRCMPTWLRWDMAPPLPQGDVFAWAIFSAGMNICVDLLGIADRVSWTGRWRQRDDFDTTPFVEVGRSLPVDELATSG